MAYKQLPIVNEEFATTKYANQIKDNFDAIVGGQSVRETLTQLSNRLTSVSEQFGIYNDEIQRLITEFNSLKKDIDKALDNIDLRFEQLSADVIKKITTVSDNLKRLEDSTGYNTNLHQYFKNVNQARNLVLAINKLHEDVGDPRNLTTKVKENTVSSINELDREMGNLESLTTTEKGTVVGSINELDREIGPLNTLTTKNKNTIVQAISEVETELGNVENLTTANKNNAVNAINELDREVGNLSTLTTKHKDTIVGSINELDKEVGDLNTLTTAEKRTIVGSINELDREMGNLSGLTTERKENIVVSINELDREMGDLSELTTKNKNTIVEAVSEIENELGDVEVLTTQNRSNAVSAINELDAEIGNISTLNTKDKDTIVDSINELEKELGNVESLTTKAKNNSVSAINELDREVGDLSLLSTKNKNTIIESINELDREMGGLEALSTTNRNNVVEAINELDSEIGTKNSLTTTNKNTLVEAINEIDSDVGGIKQLTTTNKENVVKAVNELDKDIGNVKQLTTKNKSDSVSAINELDREVGNIEDITDEEILSTNLSNIINNLKNLLGTFNSINQIIKQDNFVNTINNLYDKLDKKIIKSTLKKGKNIDISPENNINVLGGVTKDYLPETKYYKNDFIWNRDKKEEKDILYKVIQDFTSTNFEEDLNINFVEVKTGSDITTSKVVNTYNENTEFETGDIILTTEINNVEKAKLFKTKKQVKGVDPSEENDEYFEPIQLGEKDAENILFKDLKPTITFPYDIDFPRYKLTNIVKDSVNLQIRSDAGEISNLSFKKSEEDGYYYLIFDLDLSSFYSKTKNKKELPSMAEFTPLLFIEKVDEQTESVNQAAIFSHLFPINEYIELEPNECICDVDDLFVKVECAFVTDVIFNNYILFGVRPEFNPELVDTAQINNLKIKIKERRRLDLDLNFLSFVTNYGGTDLKNTLNLKIEKTEEKKIKFKGSFNCKDENNGSGMTILLFVVPNLNNILSNYFNDEGNEIENCGSTNKGKQLKILSMNKNNNNTFLLSVQKQDNSNFEDGEILNFEFEPTKGNEPLDDLIVENMSNVEDVRKFAIYVQKELAEIKKRLK